MIRNTFEFELLSAKDLDRHIDWITDAVTAAKITEGYRSDYRSSASITLDGKAIRYPLGTIQSYAIRIYHRTFDGTSETTEVMGTFIPDGIDRDLLLGRWTGTISLYSLLLKEGTDLRRGDRSIPAGTDFRTHFQNVVSGSGGMANVSDSISGTFGNSHIWEAGKSALSELQAIADACNGYVGVDAFGNVTLTPYQIPRDRAYSWVIDSDTAQITDALKETVPDVVNRVVCHHESGDLIGDGSCNLEDISPAHPWCRSRIGRWATEDYQVENIPDTITTNEQLGSWLDAKAKQRMQEIAGAATKYDATMLYDPRMKPGTRGGIYIDVGTEMVFHNVVITQRETELTPSMQMDLTLEVV